jgi:hypothetical protein
MDLFATLRPYCSLQAIADLLNQQEHTTRYGKPWTDVAVLRACRRLSEANAPQMHGAVTIRPLIAMIGRITST